jgi:hypothetical protein
MHKTFSYRILIIGLRVGLGFLASTAFAQTQQYVPTAPTQSSLYCSGVVTNKPVAKDSYLISGEDSRFKTTFSTGDFVFINQGAEHGVKVGDEFEVIRPATDPPGLVWYKYQSGVAWFKYQSMLSHAMGTTYEDIGRLRVVHVDGKTSTAEMSMSCTLMHRGDIVRPFAARPAPQFHNVKFDPFAAPSGKKTAMVVNTKDFGTMAAAGKIVYVNLGSDQGVRIGDYFRVFRYQGTHIDTLYQVKNSAYMVEGFGGTPAPYGWNNLPRQILGEGIVLRTGPNSSTVLLTDSRQEIFSGDYVELE